jgi:hypothetical protein
MTDSAAPVEKLSYFIFSIILILRDQIFSDLAFSTASRIGVHFKRQQRRMIWDEIGPFHKIRWLVLFITQLHFV